jgi:hypothetical protein
VVLDDAYASSEHAKIVWTGTSWELRDLGSKNGTFVDGMRVAPGKAYPLRAGATIGFGEETGWIVEDALAPGASAIDLDTKEIIAGTSELLALPDEEHPLISLYPVAPGVWQLEGVDGETRRIVRGEQVELGGRRFQIELPGHAEATPTFEASFSLANVALRFQVSRDEEQVEIGIDLRGEITWLEPREHSYFLLTLARMRESDWELPAVERGWRTVAELTRLLKLDEDAINLLTHRARKQLSTVGLEGAAGIVEVARRRRRLGVARFSVVRAD